MAGAVALGRSGSLTRPTAFSLALVVSFAIVAFVYPSLVRADPGDYIESFGPDGTASNEFERPAGVAVDQETGAVYVNDSERQVLEKFEEDGSPVNWGGSAGYISGNQITGVSPNPNPYLAGVAVDPATHVVYVSSANKIKAFESNGEPHNFTAGPGVGTNEIPGATELYGIAVDESGNIYTSDHGDRKVRIYAASGSLITEFAPIATNPILQLDPTSIAVGPDGTLYVASYVQKVYAFRPSQFPLTNEVTYGFGKALQEGPVVSEAVAVDPLTGYVYIGEHCNELCLSPSASKISVYDSAGNLVRLLAVAEPGGPGEIMGSTVGLAINGTAKKLYALIRGELGGLSRVSVYESISFFVGSPTVTGSSATQLSRNSARLRAKINPNTLPTTYHFEYGPESCTIYVCNKVPLPDTPIGAGHEAVVVSTEISGLQAGTTYHYRVVAENAEGQTATPDKTFATETYGLGFSPADDRVWEMVSPPEKLGARLFHIGEGIMQAAADGNGVGYSSSVSIEGDPAGNRAIQPSTVLSRRSADGSWASEDVSAPHQEVTTVRLGSEYKAFSPDLGRAVLEQQDNTPLSPEASEETPYLRESSEPAKYIPLLTGKEPFANVPPGTVFGGGNGSGDSPVTMRAANSELTYLVLNSRAPLVAGAEAHSLYLWHDGFLEPVSELPEGGPTVVAEPGSNLISVRHAISEDGSRVFWAPGHPGLPAVDLPALYLRDTVANETVRIDVKEAGASGVGDAHPAFMVASADGSVVFFTDSQHLTTDASPDGRDLYRCQVGDVGGGTLGCTDLDDLSSPLEGSGESGEAEALAAGASEDGRLLYFIAGGVLDSEPNQAGESAVPGGNNLYLWREGHGTRFVAALSEGDKPDWGQAPQDGVGNDKRLTADSSPSGRYLTFMSDRPLTGYESADATTFEPTEEVFRYDAITENLACVSCNPSGASPEGAILNPTHAATPEVDPREAWNGRWVAAVLPEAQESEPNIGLAFRRPRAMLDNGRVFFNAVDSLVPADSNGDWDVYEWEPTGVGDCTASSGGAAVARSAGGCVSLLSSGTGSEEASFIDASETGDDVFFLTPAQLSVNDEDEELDVYDARVNGIPATRAPSSECLGEACLPAANPPNDPTPASAAYQGPGNPHPKARECPKGKRAVHKNGKTRCVAGHHKKRHHHGNRRAHR